MQGLRCVAGKDSRYVADKSQFNQLHCLSLFLPRDRTELAHFMIFACPAAAAATKTVVWLLRMTLKQK